MRQKNKQNKTKKNVVELLTLYNFGRDVPEAFFPWPNLHTGLAEIKNHRVFSVCVCVYVCVHARVCGMGARVCVCACVRVRARVCDRSTHYNTQVTRSYPHR